MVYATLINRPELCPHCEKAEIIIQGYTEAVVKLPPTVECPTRLKLRKQRYKCKCCGKTFVAKTDIVKKGCQISQSTKQAIALQATKKISEKDIAARAGVSHNTVNRIISSYYEGYSVNYHYLPQAMCFDEFKSTKDADGAMSFIYCDAKTHKILDIVENRRLENLKSYFYRFPIEARRNVKYIVIDIYKPYFSLIKACFPNAKIIIDKFHIVNNFSMALNKTRIMLMNSRKDLYNKLKNYYKLLLKNRYELDGVHYFKCRCFKGMMSQRDIVDYLLDQDSTLKNTYYIYQELLIAIKTRDTQRLQQLSMTSTKDISGYMKTALQTLKDNLAYFSNSLLYNYSNGIIEGINNKIKVIKRISFGYRSFFNFRNRILIMCNLICIKKAA